MAGQQLRNKAIAVTLAALVGILLYIAFRFEWTYGAAAVIAVFHDVLVTLGFFSIFQWEISLTVIAALLTLVGFSVNDTIVVFDRIRENRRLHRRDSLYKVTNDSINQTLSRTVITSGLVFPLGPGYGALWRRSVIWLLGGVADRHQLWNLLVRCYCKSDHGLVGAASGRRESGHGGSTEISRRFRR